MPDLSIARRLPLGYLPQSGPGHQGHQGDHATRPAWWPAWSVPAALRMLRAVLVVPSLFALTYEGFGNLQMALFAAFGGFAHLVFAAFGGTRRDKLIAHFGLAAIGSLALIIGTAVTGWRAGGWPRSSRPRSCWRCRHPPRGTGCARRRLGRPGRWPPTWKPRCAAPPPPRTPRPARPLST